MTFKGPFQPKPFYDSMIPNTVVQQDHYVGLIASGQCPREELLDILKIFGS